MEGFKKVLNYIAIILIVVGIALFKIIPDKSFIGWIILALGVAGYIFYLYLNRDNLKDSLKRKTLLYSSNLFIIVILVLAIIVALNILTMKLQKRYDFTEGKIYSLSPQTIKVLKNLKKDLSIKAFYSDTGTRVAEDTLKLYRFYSPKIRYEIIDPNKNPGLARRYNITAEGTTVLEYGDKEEKLESLTEEELTNAIIKITRETKKKVCFLQGHGEASVKDTDKTGISSLGDSLKKVGYEVSDLNIAEKGKIPESCDILVVAGPQKPLFDNEIKMMDDFIKEGKSVFLMVDPDTGSKLEKMIKKYGVSLDNDVVVDLVSRVLSGDPLMPIVNKYEYHEITKNFKYAALFPYARSVTALKPAPKDVSVTELAKTSPNAWGETNMKEELKTGKLTFNPDQDKPGPVSLIAVSDITINEKDGKSKEARLVVVGDSDFAKNSFIGTSGNENLIMNIINYLSQQKDLISITPKSARTSAITLTPAQGSLIFYVSIVILPLLLLFIGIAVWIRRRAL